MIFLEWVVFEDSTILSPAYYQAVIDADWRLTSVEALGLVLMGGEL